VSQNLIRNFSIIAHIDHGKSTLADRLIQYCGGLSEREMEAQVLDSMDLEKERGITIKGTDRCLELQGAGWPDLQAEPDRHPGHVTFPMRCRARCRHARARCWWSTPRRGWKRRRWPTATRDRPRRRSHPGAEQDRSACSRPGSGGGGDRGHRGAGCSEAVRASAKNGIGIAEILEVVVKQVPPPRGQEDAPLKALIIDSCSIITLAS